MKCCLLQNSRDEKVRKIYQSKQNRVSTFQERWSGPKELQRLQPIAEHSFRFAGQSGRAGLGSFKEKELKYVAKPSDEDRRSKVVQILKQDLEETYIRQCWYS